MKPKEKINKIVDLINEGKTVYFSTALKSIEVNKKVIDKFNKAGYDLFKSDGKSMYIRQGKSFVCIDYCKITYV